jgi:hypothetical protein
MPFWLRPGAWRALCASAAALALAASTAGAITQTDPGALPSSALALPLPPSDLSRRLGDETAPPTQQTQSKKPSNLGDVGRSLVLPGWGSLHQGHRNVGLAFLVVEAGLWTTVAVSAGQGGMRINSSFDTAQLYAGIDLRAHDDNFRKLVANYQSSDEYNRLVVYRDAAALYYGDFADYTAYIDRHSLKGADTWNWQDTNQWTNYQELRRSSERAYQRARFAAAGLIVNRIAAAIVASRMTPRAEKVAIHEATSGEGFAVGPVEWTIASTPDRPLDLHHRIAWVIPLE